jgi:hypothetical protein
MIDLALVEAIVLGRLITARYLFRLLLLYRASLTGILIDALQPDSQI